ncbi:MAG: hypothetical protein MJY54_00830 [archaeon]|nr:hypothetical protein [archaeon]
MITEEFMLNINGKYLVRVAEEDDTIGIFRGYSALGSDTAIAIEMDGGRIRLIPVAQIIYIDVLSSGEFETKDSDKNRGLYYG